MADTTIGVAAATAKVEIDEVTTVARKESVDLKEELKAAQHELQQVRAEQKEQLRMLQHELQQAHAESAAAREEAATERAELHRLRHLVRLNKSQDERQQASPSLERAQSEAMERERLALEVDLGMGQEALPRGSAATALNLAMATWGVEVHPLQTGSSSTGCRSERGLSKVSQWGYQAKQVQCRCDALQKMCDKLKVTNERLINENQLISEQLQIIFEDEAVSDQVMELMERHGQEALMDSDFYLMELPNMELPNK